MDHLTPAATCLNGPQADLRQYLFAFRRRWRMMVITFVVIFALASAFVVSQKSAVVTPSTRQVSATAIVYVPAPPTIPSQVGPVAGLPYDPTLGEIAKICQQPWSWQDRLLGGSENCTRARASLPAELQAKAANFQVRAGYQDEKRLLILLTVTGPDPGIARAYAEAILNTYARTYEQEAKEARNSALSLVTEVVSKLRVDSEAVFAMLEKTPPDLTPPPGSAAAGQGQTSSSLVQLQSAAARYAQLAAAVTMIEDMSEARLSRTDVGVAAAPDVRVRVVPKKTKLLLAALASALVAVVVALVADSILSPQAPQS